jgi:hypothetical protein
MVCREGVEPSTSRVSSWRSVRLSYRHMDWRRGWDSNPRACDSHTVSSGARSSALAPLLGLGGRRGTRTPTGDPQPLSRRWPLDRLGLAFQDGRGTENRTRTRRVKASCACRYTTPQRWRRERDLNPHDCDVQPLSKRRPVDRLGLSLHGGNGVTRTRKHPEALTIFPGWPLIRPDRFLELEPCEGFEPPTIRVETGSSGPLS